MDFDCEFQPAAFGFFLGKLPVSVSADYNLEEPLRNHNRQGLQRKEILRFMVRDFGEYTWSLRSLDRKLSYFNIHRNDKSVSVEDVISAINKELMGPGRLLGYRAMHLKI